MGVFHVSAVLWLSSYNPVNYIVYSMKSPSLQIDADTQTAPPTASAKRRACYSKRVEQRKIEEFIKLLLTIPALCSCYC